jgi:hypothetical protein
MQFNFNFASLTIHFVYQNLVERLSMFWVCYNVPCHIITSHCDFSGCPRWVWLNRQSSLSSVDPTTLTVNAVYSWSLQSQGERHWMSSLVAGQHFQLCVSPSLLILPDIPTHYVLKLHYFNSLSAVPHLPVPHLPVPHHFPPLSTRITIGSLHHLLLPKILHSLSCVWRENMLFTQDVKKVSAHLTTVIIRCTETFWSPVPCTHTHTHTRYYHFTCDMITHHWNIHKITTHKPS